MKVGLNRKLPKEIRKRLYLKWAEYWFNEKGGLSVFSATLNPYFGHYLGICYQCQEYLEDNNIHMTNSEVCVGWGEWAISFFPEISEIEQSSPSGYWSMDHNSGGYKLRMNICLLAAAMV